MNGERTATNIFEVLTQRGIAVIVPAANEEIGEYKNKIQDPTGRSTSYSRRACVLC